MSNRTNKKAPDNRGNNEEKELEMLLRSIWLGRQDSNLRMTGPKPVALPLGDDPTTLRLWYNLGQDVNFYTIYCQSPGCDLSVCG